MSPSRSSTTSTGSALRCAPRLRLAQKSELDRAWTQDAWAFLEIDVQGARRVAELYPETVTIFLKAPSEQEYEARLRRRGTETDEDLRRRMTIAREELAAAGFYKHRVVNDDVERAVREISQILISRENAPDAG